MSSSHSLTASSTTTLSDALHVIAEVLQLDGLVGKEGLSAAMQEMEAELLVIGADAYRAEVQGISLRRAVQDHERCPALAKLHTSIEDMLTLGLPRELREWGRKLIAAGVPPAFEAMLRTLVKHARRDPNPVRQALCKLIVFEGVRFGLLLRARLATEDTRDRLQKQCGQKELLRKQLEGLQARSTDPVPLPTPESIVKAVFEIEGLLRADPTRARQALRTMLKDGIIELEPQADGTYIARGTVFPLMPLLLQPLEKPKPRDREAEGLQVVYRSSCAGAIRPLEHAVFKVFALALVA